MKKDSIKAKERNATDALPSDVPADAAVYQEYVRGFDDIPVLQDAVHIPPRPPVQPDFRRGERRDARKEPRPDAYSIREKHRAELEQLYGEYVEPPAVARATKKRKTAKRKAAKRKTKKRKAAKRASGSRSVVTESGA